LAPQVGSLVSQVYKQQWPKPAAPQIPEVHASLALQKKPAPACGRQPVAPQ
jgi:hypothetical protein